MLIIWLDSYSIGGRMIKMSPGEAAARGLIEPGGKTGVEMAIEQAVAAQTTRKAARAAKRARRREQAAHG